MKPTQPFLTKQPTIVAEELKLVWFAIYFGILFLGLPVQVKLPFFRGQPHVIRQLFQTLMSIPELLNV